MKKLILLVSLLSIFVACTNQKKIDAKAKHQAETGKRLNESQQNTDKLFDEMDK